MKKITIDPVTRIEGHSRITIHLADDGSVQDAKFHVTQFRGFEKLSEGRPFYEMPALSARTCGICPVAHLVTASKAADEIMGVRIPEAGEKLRRVINLAQIVQSHALSFFHLSSPDFLLGMDGDPGERNIFGLMDKKPEFAKDGIALRKTGQQIIETLGGKRIHPSWIVPGGVEHPLSLETRDQILSTIPPAIEIAKRGIDFFKGIVDSFREEIMSFGNFPSLFMGLVTPEGNLEHYDGKIRIVDSAGHIVDENIDGHDYLKHIGEAVEDYSYLKSPYLKSKGYEDGMYRVGPLARLNVVDRCGTPLADQELAEFKEIQRGAVLSSFYYHYARLIEILYGLEMIQILLEDPAILSKRVRAFAEANNLEGIGVAEAPRGILMHHYKIDDQGLVTWANLIIATGHNNLAMNRGILQAAKHFVKADRLQEGMLNRVEAVIRAFDPCLSCSTHALGQMELKLDLVAPDGRIVDSLSRSR